MLEVKNLLTTVVISKGDLPGIRLTLKSFSCFSGNFPGLILVLSSYSETEIEIIPNTRTYDQIDKNLRVARYHSLQIEEKSLSSVTKSILITGIDPLRKVPLSFEDLERKLFGLQYHPESFLSKQGKRIIQNIHHACLDNIGGSNPTP